MKEKSKKKTYYYKHFKDQTTPYLSQLKLNMV